MSWTKEKPTVPGYYWVRGGWYEFGVALIDMDTPQMTWRLGVEDPEFIDDIDEIEWYGPLEVPK